MAMSPEAKALLRAARRAPERPSTEARERMKRSVLGAAAFGAASASSAVGAAASSGGAAVASGTAAAATGAAAGAKVGLTAGALWKIVGSVVVASGIVVGGVTTAVVAARSPAPTSGGSAALPAVVELTAIPSAVEPAPERAGEPLTRARTERSSEPERTGEAEKIGPQALPAVPAKTSQPAAAALAPVPPATAAASPDEDPLKAEAQLLSAAQSALAKGAAARALELTSEHAAKFPKGALASERRAIRAMSLCSLGRRDEGRAEATPLIERAPTSPLSQRLAEACK
jgi:hypothetical protein